MVRSVWHTSYGMWRVAGGRQHILAEVTMYVDMVVYTLSLVWPP
jgi:hypothetical protein